MIAAFDTHSSVKTLTAAGMPEGQAEAITELFKASRDADLNVLATKADLAQLRADLQQQIAELRADLQQQIAEVRSDLQQQITAVRSDLQQQIAALRGDIQRDIAETKADILKWMFGMIAGAVIINVMAIIGAMLALVRMVGH
ncbi:MAG TPA: coiled-coil domain-containing protein [Stellaceae bacterium]|nr:coiled-coil domain-containing protein [Stellaceae bacterium]